MPQDVSDKSDGENAEQHRSAAASPAAIRWPPGVRDLRDHPGRLTVLAQIVAAGESTAILTTSGARAVELLQSRLPLKAITGDGAISIGWAGGARGPGELARARVMVVEWGAVIGLLGTLKGYSHVVVFDPPYRGSHLNAASALSEEGASVHLIYGAAEREESAALLRYLVHPRFAMVCVHNATRSDAKQGEEEILKAARRLGWEQARVCLTGEDLGRARAILRELGVETLQGGQAKLDARASKAYREAEADYEECVRSCLTL